MNNKITLPSTNYEGKITVNGKDIPCAVLFPESENPQRVLVQREVVGVLTGNKKGGLGRYLQPKNLQPFIPEKFKDKTLEESTIAFKFRGRPAQGFLATDLIDICHMYLKARNKRTLLPNQLHLADMAEIIILAFAKTGIIAVIDEVTGFQEVRDRLALNKILEKYLLDEYQKVWTKRFPNEFYEELFRLKKWQWKGMTVKRPSVIGYYTNDIVYKRLSPEVLTELLDRIKKRNIQLEEKGKGKVHQHQWLTLDTGIPALDKHLYALIALMRASRTYDDFHRRVVQAFPLKGETPDLFTE